MMRKPNVDLEKYAVKMNDYEDVFDAVATDFNDSMFGLYSNSVTREVFNRNLMQDGWKYFDLHNLNELFSIKYEEWVIERKNRGDPDADIMPLESDVRLVSK